MVSQFSFIDIPNFTPTASRAPHARPAAPWPPAAGAAAAEPAAVAAVLSGLLADVAASVRPTLDKEKEDLQHDPDLGTRPVRIRRNAEALLAAAERVNAPAFRQQHAALWPALAAELDRRLTEACYASIYGEDDWDDDHSTVWGRVSCMRAPSHQVSSMCPGSCCPFVGWVR